MTSLRQIESNRRNARKSTGPTSDIGKQRASRNAVRHGLTAETVIIPFEDSDDYEAFEQAVIADYDAETAVERELVLRLASLLWRLRRATLIETGLFQIQSEIQDQPDPEQHARAFQGFEVMTAFGLSDTATDVSSESSSHGNAKIAWCFLRLAHRDNGALEGLNRYEAALWRQVRQTLFTLKQLRWRTSAARSRRPHDSWHRAIVAGPRRDW